jgi:hypothetical protein
VDIGSIRKPARVWARKTTPGVGIYRAQGSWTLLGRSTGHPGRIEYRIEHRSNIGSDLSPSQLGGEIGTAALNSGFGCIV